MKALITNDDGIAATGLQVLATAAVAAGLDATVAAPQVEMSGSSARLTALEAGGRLLVDDASLPDLDVRALAVQASPALIVFVASRGAFGDPPDVVLCGVNHGPNTGQAVLHSGTVGAALTATTHGLPALAVSLAAGKPRQWATAAAATRGMLDWFLARADHPFALNVNVPDVAPDAWRGYRAASLAGFGAVQARVVERDRGHLIVTFEEIDADPGEGTDLAALRAGWASVTEVQAPCQGATCDLSTLPPTPSGGQLGREWSRISDHSI